MAGTIEPWETEKKVKEGWIHATMMIEVLGITKEAAESALQNHVEPLQREKRTLVVKKAFKETRLVKNPHPNIPEGFSQIAEIEFLARDFDTLVYTVMNYVPSSVEILAPQKITVDMGEAQGILASIASLIHKFASQGIGGVIIRS